MPPDVDLDPDDATAAIAVAVTNPTPTVPDPDLVYDVAYSEIQIAAPTYSDRLMLFPNYDDIQAHIPPAPDVTSVDIWRREEAIGGPGIRIAAGLDPADGFVDYTPASGVAYQYRAVAHASSNGTSTAGGWVGNVDALFPATTLFPSLALFPTTA